MCLACFRVLRGGILWDSELNTRIYPCCGEYVWVVYRAAYHNYIICKDLQGIEHCDSDRAHFSAELSQ